MHFIEIQSKKKDWKSKICISGGVIQADRQEMKTGNIDNSF